MARHLQDLDGFSVSVYVDLTESVELESNSSKSFYVLPPSRRCVSLVLNDCVSVVFRHVFSLINLGLGGLEQLCFVDRRTISCLQYVC